MLMNIGRIVRERRQAKGMTIEQLAEKADVSVSLISRLERERVDNIKLANLAAIANALQLQMADFFRDPRLQTAKVVELLDYLAEQPEKKREDAAALMLRLMKL
ncbi:helix-turn-helix domain-containing protein [Lacticaseibacillus rhamnosus]|uniref:helix-turn-helix domain-containing protein n=1 Tax=Lacticaseibacillus rhamnosus TaxID=47715 RepID=UPI0005E6A40E|nr:helix-turn-helix transcriptional regulator [Lacticaseibacillus rhamnosus]OAT93556.1 XRE family transcriptional regulator [Lacticaseibacillus rhamnosus]CDN23466.1 transcription regulator [Lacticaseibacillus rhamnosus]